jgi:hypothetical protein
MFNAVIAFPTGNTRQFSFDEESEARAFLCRRWRKYNVGGADMDLYCLGYHIVGEMRGQMLHKVRGHHLPTWIPVKCFS